MEEEEAAVDEEEAKEELEEPEFMRRTYPREVAFKEGDVPLEGLWMQPSRVLCLEQEQTCWNGVQIGRIRCFQTRCRC